MAEKPPEELKIEDKGGVAPEAEVSPEEERVTPDVEADFMGLLKDYGVAEKAARIVTKHIAETGTENVFEDPTQLLEKLAKFSRQIPPVTRKNILDHWTTARKIPVPEGFEKEAAMSSEALARKGKETTPEKYSVDTQTGTIKVATTTDKALTWDEAVKLSTEIKRDLEGVSKEPPFILGEGGAWTLNPKGKIGFGEFAVFQMYQDSLRRGEPIDPVEELTRRAEQSVRLQEAMGVKVGGGDSEMTTLDKLDKLGLLKKSGEEGSSSQLDLLDKLDGLGMLKKTGEGDAGSQTLVALQVEVKDLKESLQKQEMDSLKNVVASMVNQVSELRKEIVAGGRLEGRYALLEKTITTIDGQLSGIRSDVKPLLSAIGGGGAETRKKTPEERAKLTKGLKEAVALEQEAKALEDELVFGVGSQG